MKKLLTTTCKSEPNGVLERARQLYKDRTNELYAYVDKLNSTFQGTSSNLGFQILNRTHPQLAHLNTTPELRLGNDNHYYLRFQWTDVERELSKNARVNNTQNLPNYSQWRQCALGGVEIVNGIRRKRHFDCQTLELIQKSSQIQRQADIATAHSDKAIVELKQALLDYSETLLDVNEAIAVVDMLSSFAYLATTRNYVRPMIADTLVLKAARHPMAEVRKTNFIPNDVYSGDQGARFQVITGGNMSGKSTFIRSIALIQILTQIGSFVPAQYAAVPICDRLFTRLSTEDKPENNLGTFAVEMTEINVVLRFVNLAPLAGLQQLLNKITDKLQKTAW